jgi:hypothetical protein
MTFWDDLWKELSDAPKHLSWLTGGGLQTPFEATGAPTPETVQKNLEAGLAPGTDLYWPEGIKPVDNESKDVWAAGWLRVMFGIPVAILGAPIAYKAITSGYKGKRAQKASEVGESLENASTRAVTLASAYLPAFGLPVAYITVQAMEKKGYITKGLGDAVQSLIAAGAVAPAIGGVLQFASKALPVKGAK